MTWVIALACITIVSTAVYLTTFLIDSATQGSKLSLSDLVLSPNAQGALSNMPEVITGILGITITVVAIIVELASNRYTPRVTELFVRSPVNLAVLTFYVITGLMCIWVSLTGASPEFTPRVGMAVTLCFITVSMLILLPYFAFVFGFLNPHNIIEHMANSALRAIRRGDSENRSKATYSKLAAMKGIEQLSDVALNAIEHKDKGICMHAVETLGALTRNYLDSKKTMPDNWFVMDPQISENTDFVSLHHEVIQDIEKKCIWLEMKTLRQYQMLYGETLNRMRDINYLIAINTRKLAEQTMDQGEDHSTSLAIKFMNTFLRATINGRDVRTAYNVLNQYRLLAEHALKIQRYDVAVEAAARFKYYGQLGFNSGIPFILETAAYDLCTLNEMAFDLNASCMDEMLSIFLDVDKEAEEGHALEASLRGVRKAQVKLATYYLTNNAEHLARTIFEDMSNELPQRLASIREELASIDTKEFWEINDRGVNFDYLEPSRRNVLNVFFGWFSNSDQTVTVR